MNNPVRVCTLGDIGSSLAGGRCACQQPARGPLWLPRPGAALLSLKRSAELERVAHAHDCIEKVSCLTLLKLGSLRVAASRKGLGGLALCSWQQAAKRGASRSAGDLAGFVPAILDDKGTKLCLVLCSRCSH